MAQLLVNRPNIILAEETTVNLEAIIGNENMRLPHRIAKEKQQNVQSSVMTGASRIPMKAFYGGRI